MEWFTHLGGSPWSRRRARCAAVPQRQAAPGHPRPSLPSCR